MKLQSISLACLIVLSVRAEQPTDDTDKNRLAEKRSVADNQPSHPQSLFSGFLSGVTGTANEERAKDDRNLKDFISFDGIQNYLINALKPKPIVDTANEAEKNTPNQGTSVKVLGDLVVKGTETLSRALNTVLEAPKQAAFKFSAGATKALNQLGAYISGL